MNYLGIAGVKCGVETIELILSNRERIREVFKAALESCNKRGTAYTALSAEYPVHLCTGYHTSINIR